MKVSVCITTYNHGEFIVEALDSVMSQEVEFDYEVLVGEDQSSDNTREIVLEYAKRFPDKITVFLHDYPEDYVRVNGRTNFVFNLEKARGEYIALLDGDDYWTDTRKLAKQVAFLDSHPAFSTVFHRADWIENGLITKGRYGPYEVKEFYTVDDLLEYSNFIPSCSAMFRRGLFGDFPDWFYKAPYGDLPLHVMNALHGKIGFINESMAVYRVHSGGRYTCKSDIYKMINNYHCFELMARNLNLWQKESCQRYVSQLYNKIIKIVKEEDILLEAISLLDKVVSDFPHHFSSRNLQAELKMRAGDRVGATTILMDILMLSPWDISALNKLALDSLQEGDIATAHWVLRRLRWADPCSEVLMKNIKFTKKE